MAHQHAVVTFRALSLIAWFLATRHCIRVRRATGPSRCHILSREPPGCSSYILRARPRDSSRSTLLITTASSLALSRTMEPSTDIDLPDYSPSIPPGYSSTPLPGEQCIQRTPREDPSRENCAFTYEDRGMSLTLRGCREEAGVPTFGLCSTVYGEFAPTDREKVVSVVAKVRIAFFLLSPPFLNPDAARGTNSGESEHGSTIVYPLFQGAPAVAERRLNRRVPQSVARFLILSFRVSGQGSRSPPSSSSFHVHHGPMSGGYCVLAKYSSSESYRFIFSPGKVSPMHA